MSDIGYIKYLQIKNKTIKKKEMSYFDVETGFLIKMF